MSYLGYGIYQPQFGYPRMDGFGYPGFGNPDTQADLATFMAQTVKDVSANSSLVASMTPQSRIVLSAMETAINSAIGKPLDEVSSTVLANVVMPIAGLIVDTVRDVVNDVVSGVDTALQTVGDIPILGTAVGFLTTAFRLEELEHANYEAGVKQAEIATANMQKYYIPRGDLPADIFARVYTSGFSGSPVVGINYSSCSKKAVEWKKRLCPPPGLEDISNCQRPIIGQILLRMTEGGDSAGSLYCNPEGDACFTIIDKIVAHARELNTDLKKLGIPPNANPFYGSSKWGPSMEDRKLFRSLRRTMQASWCVQGSDGGASLWPIYMDLLLKNSNEGRITFKYGSTMISIQPATWGWDPMYTSVWTPTVGAIMTMIDAWDNKVVRPVYAQDIAKQAKAEQLAIDIAKKATTKKIPFHVPISISRTLLASLKKPKTPLKKIAMPITAKKKMTPAKAVGIGAGAAALLLFFL